MINNNFTSGNAFQQRQQYIRTNNELRNGPDTSVYVEGNKQKVELDRKLEEISINTDSAISGRVVRQNILNASASGEAAATPVVVDTSVGEEAKARNERMKEAEDNPIIKSSPSYEKQTGRVVNPGSQVAKSFQGMGPAGPNPFRHNNF